MQFVWRWCDPVCRIWSRTNQAYRSEFARGMLLTSGFNGAPLALAVPRTGLPTVLTVILCMVLPRRSSRTPRARKTPPEQACRCAYRWYRAQPSLDATMTSCQRKQWSLQEIRTLCHGACDIALVSVHVVNARLRTHESVCAAHPAGLT